MVDTKVKPAAETKRIPLHKQNLFTAPNIPGFKTMFVNETVGAIEAHQLAGWELVIDDKLKMKTHDSLSQVETQFDSVVRRVVNKSPRASFRHAVLMKIPLHIYEEDQTAEQAEISSREQQYKYKTKDEYGDVNIS